MFEKLVKSYSFTLVAGGSYYAVLFALQYGDIYSSWQAWAHPNYDISSYSMLALFYVLAVGTPIFMVLSGAVTYKFGIIKWYLAVPLFVLLVLSGLVGKLILVVGVCVFIYGKWFHVDVT
jgi:hypothetical protein